MIAVSSEFCANMSSQSGTEDRQDWLDGRIKAVRVTDTCCGWNGKCPHGPMCSNTRYPASGTVQGSRGTWGTWSTAGRYPLPCHTSLAKADGNWATGSPNPESTHQLCCHSNKWPKIAFSKNSTKSNKAVDLAYCWGRFQKPLKMRCLCLYQYHPL